VISNGGKKKEREGGKASGSSTGGNQRIEVASCFSLRKKDGKKKTRACNENLWNFQDQSLTNYSIVLEWSMTKERKNKKREEGRKGPWTCFCPIQEASMV